jgi:hypothetical protein
MANAKCPGGRAANAKLNGEYGKQNRYGKKLTSRYRRGAARKDVQHGRQDYDQGTGN